jgi:hypothetical protein
MSMKESSTYQAILEEGRQEGRSEGAVAEAKKLLRALGSRRFGDPDSQSIAAIERIADLALLEDLCNRLDSAGSWQELLRPAVAGSRKGRRRPST